MGCVVHKEVRQIRVISPSQSGKNSRIRSEQKPVSTTYIEQRNDEESKNSNKEIEDIQKLEPIEEQQQFQDIRRSTSTIQYRDPNALSRSSINESRRSAIKKNHLEILIPAQLSVIPQVNSTTSKMTAVERFPTPTLKFDSKSEKSGPIQLIQALQIYQDSIPNFGPSKRDKNLDWISVQIKI